MNDNKINHAFEFPYFYEVIKTYKNFQKSLS